MNHRLWPMAIRERLGDGPSAALADVFEEHENTVLKIVTERFERRLGEECAKLRAELGEARTELHTELGAVRAELREQCGSLRADFRVELAAVRADFIKWSFLFWIGQAATIAGLFIALR